MGEQFHFVVRHSDAYGSGAGHGKLALFAEAFPPEHLIEVKGSLSIFVHKP